MMVRGKMLLRVVALSVCICVALTGCRMPWEKPSPDKVAARIAKMDGGVTAEGPDGAPIELSRRLRLYAGSAVSTGRGAASLDLEGGGSVRLDKNSSVKLDFSGGLCKVTLTEGSAGFEAEGGVVLAASDTELAVKRGVGWISVDGDTVTAGLVDGRAEITCGDSSKKLSSGTLAVVSGGEIETRDIEDADIPEFILDEDADTPSGEPEGDGPEELPKLPALPAIPSDMKRIPIPKTGWSIDPNGRGYVTADGTAYMWGAIWGLSSYEYDIAPEQAERVGGDVRGVYSNQYYTRFRGDAPLENAAVLKNDGTLWIWGDGSIGDGELYGWGRPQERRKILDDVAAFSCNSEYAMAAVKTDGTLWLWGSVPRWDGVEGYNEDLGEPTHVMDNVRDVSISDSTVAVITNDDVLLMWGRNYYGQVGVGTTEDVLTPTAVLENVQSVSASANHTSAITKDGALYVWGSNEFGQLGTGYGGDVAIDRTYEVYEYDGDTTSYSTVDWSFNVQTTPVKLMDGIVAAVTGDFYSEALTARGEFYAWGSTPLCADNDMQIMGPNSSGGSGDWQGIRSKPEKIADGVAAIGLQAYVTRDGSVYVCASKFLDDGTYEPPALRKLPAAARVPE